MAKIVRADVARLERENNRLTYENERLNAILEYVAMMADVDLPFDEEVSDEAEVEEE